MLLTKLDSNALGAVRNCVCAALETESITVWVSTEFGLDHQLEYPGLDHVVHIAIEQPEHVRSDRKLDGAFFTGMQPDPLKASQGHHRSGHGCDPLVNIELRHFIPVTLSRITDIDRYPYGRPPS